MRIKGALIAALTHSTPLSHLYRLRSTLLCCVADMPATSKAELQALLVQIAAFFATLSGTVFPSGYGSRRLEEEITVVAKSGRYFDGGIR